MTVDRDTGISERFFGSGTTGPFAVTNFNVATTDQIEPGGVTKVLNATGAITTLILNDPGADGYTAEISGGLVTINTVAAVASGWVLSVVRSTDKLQSVALPIVGLFSPHDVEEAMDLLAMQIQERSSIASAVSATPTDAVSAGWDTSSKIWVEIEVCVEISLLADGVPSLRLSLDGGVTPVILGYNWVSLHSVGTGGVSTVSGFVSNTAADRTRWQLTEGLVILKSGLDSRLVGNFRISRLDVGRSTKIVGAGTFNSVAGAFAHVEFSGTLDDQISPITGITVFDTSLPNNIAAGSRIDVRGIR